MFPGAPSRGDCSNGSAPPVNRYRLNEAALVSQRYAGETKYLSCQNLVDVVLVAEVVLAHRSEIAARESGVVPALTLALEKITKNAI